MSHRKKQQFLLVSLPRLRTAWAAIFQVYGFPFTPVSRFTGESLRNLSPSPVVQLAWACLQNMAQSMAAPSSAPNSPSSISLPANLPQTGNVISTNAAARMCNESVERMQLVAELLLLQSGRDKPATLEPVSVGHESYGKCRDTIVANTKGLAISIKEFGKRLHGNDLTAVYRLAQQVADQVITLTEAAAHVAYISALSDSVCEPASPPTVDRYTLTRARQELTLAYAKFKLDYGSLSREQIMQVSGAFADNLATLTQTCKQAAENKHIKISDRVQYSHCVQALQGATAAFLTSLKAFAGSNSTEDRKRCVLFGKPLLETVNSIVEYAHFTQFSGTPATLTEDGYHAQTEVLAGVMAIIGATIQFLNTGRGLLEQTKAIRYGQGEDTQWMKLVNCTKAVADATKFLSSAIRVYTPVPSLLPSRTTSLETFLN